MHLKGLHRAGVILSAMTGVLMPTVAHAEKQAIILDQWDMERDAKKDCADVEDPTANQKCLEGTTKGAQEFAHILRAIFETSRACAGITFDAIADPLNFSQAVEKAMRRPHWVLSVEYRPNLMGSHKLVPWKLRRAEGQSPFPFSPTTRHLLPSLQGPEVLGGSFETASTIVRRVCPFVAGQGKRLGLRR
jgi:hypothetical protein